MVKGVYDLISGFGAEGLLVVLDEAMRVNGVCDCAMEFEVDAGVGTIG